MAGNILNPSANRHSLLATLRHVARDEEGAAYTLSYVMVIPMYALLMCAIVEMALMLTSKLGTTYAAYAAVRSASVWSSATEWEKVQEKAKKAAVHAIVPFASGTQPLFDPTSPNGIPDDPGGATLDAGLYVGAYHRYSKKPGSVEYLGRKYAYAMLNTTVEIEGPPEKWDADITAKVTYRFPFNVPGVGRIFGEWSPNGRYFFSISSTVTLPNEGPQNDSKTLGIGYGTLDE